MKPTIKKVQPVKVVAPFLNSQSESPVPLDALTDQEKVSDLYFLKGTVHQIAKPYLIIALSNNKYSANVSLNQLNWQTYVLKIAIYPTFRLPELLSTG